MTDDGSNANGNARDRRPDGSGDSGDSGNGGSARVGESHMRRAFELAREAAGAGDQPFGSVLVLDGTEVAAERNTVDTDDDPTAHPELKLARWAGRELSPDERARTTMYTSTEPCPMCAGGIRNVGLGRVVYSTAGPALADLLGREAGIRASDVVGGETTVEGPLLPEEGLAIHESFWTD